MIRHSLGFEPRAKAVCLTAMGLRHPEHRQRYFQLARKLNYDRSFPYLLLKSIIEQGEDVVERDTATVEVGGDT